MAKAIVTGWKEIDAAFANLEPKLQGKALRGALRRGAQRIQASAIQNIVASPSVLTGKLASKFSVRAMPRSKVRVGMEIVSKGAAHANIVEYGAKHMPAEPFLRPAGYDNKEYIEAMLLDDIQAAAADPAWKFKKSVAGDVTKARKSARKLISSRKRIKKRAKVKRKRDAAKRRRERLRLKKQAVAQRKKAREKVRREITKERNKARKKAATSRQRAAAQRVREAERIKKARATARKKATAARQKAATTLKKAKSTAKKKAAAARKKRINDQIKLARKIKGPRRKKR
jgi:HK97 gp10 family phage protein